MKKLILGILMILGMGCVMAPSVGAAIGTDLCNDPNIASDLKEAAGCRDSAEEKEQTIMPVVIGMIQVVLGLVGLIGVGVVIYGGITYTISTGDAVKVNKAKNIILYGVVGLVVAMLAYAIVTFVSRSIFG